VTLSLASGLLYVSELIEEHSRLAKVIGQRGIYTIIALHVVLFFSDSLPFFQTTFSIICHIIYLQNFSVSWPLISLTSISFLASCFFVISDHFLWFFYFSRLTNEARQMRSYRGPSPNTPGFAEIASFFGICVWLIPLFLFLSLSANDNALPVSAADPGSSPGATPIQYAQAPVSLFRSLFSFKGLPRMRPKASQRDSVEGLLTPHSPTQPRSPIPPSSPSLISRYGAMTPPHSPGPHRLQESDDHTKQGQSFKLSTPPRRATAPGRNGVGLGLRKTTGTKVNEDSVLDER